MPKRINLAERKRQNEEQQKGRGFRTITNGPKQALAEAQQESGPQESLQQKSLLQESLAQESAPQASSQPHPAADSDISREDLQVIVRTQLRQALDGLTRGEIATMLQQQPTRSTKKKKSPLVKQELLLLSDEVAERLNADWERQPRRGGKSKSRLADEIFRHYYNLPPIDYE